MFGVGSFILSCLAGLGRVSPPAVTTAASASEGDDGEGQCAAGGECPVTCELMSMLSDSRDFAREPRFLPGIHVLCVWRNEAAGGQVEGYAYFGGVLGTPKRFTVSAKMLDNFKQFRKSLGKSLGVKKKTNDWGHLDLKQEYGLFDFDGVRLDSLESVLGARKLLVFEGGQWLWPPVRPGHSRSIGEGLELETLSLQPVVFRIKDFLRKEECEEIILHASDRMTPSGVLRRNADGYRTSNDTRLESWDFPFLNNIDERVANATRMPKVFHESTQVARFEKGRYYRFHADAYDPSLHEKNWVEFLDYGHRNRYATMIWYLSAVKKGGETMFPLANGLPEPIDPFKTCEDKDAMKVKPKVGNAVLFYNLHANGNLDFNVRHAGCPPRSKDGKWSANKWIWNKPTPQRS